MLGTFSLCIHNYINGLCYNSLTISAKISLASTKKTKSKTINKILKSLHKNELEQKLLMRQHTLCY